MVFSIEESENIILASIREYFHYEDPHKTLRWALVFDGDVIEEGKEHRRGMKTQCLYGPATGLKVNTQRDLVGNLRALGPGGLQQNHHLEVKGKVDPRYLKKAHSG